jgi:hypothetical protein
LTTVPLTSSFTGSMCPPAFLILIDLLSLVCEFPHWVTGSIVYFVVQRLSLEPAAPVWSDVPCSDDVFVPMKSNAADHSMVGWSVSKRKIIAQKWVLTIFSETRNSNFTDKEAVDQTHLTYEWKQEAVSEIQVRKLLVLYSSILLI